LDGLVQAAVVVMDEDRTVMSEAMTQRVTSVDLELYTLVRPGSAEAFVAALEVGLLERKRIEVTVLERIAASLGQRTAAMEACTSHGLPLSGSLPPPGLHEVKEDTEDLFD
jgi:hypothetical protein